AVDPADMRRRLDRTGGRFPDGVVGQPTRVGGVSAEWIDPPDSCLECSVLYLHGGGYVAGSIDSHRNLTGHLARALGCRVLALDYALAPENPHPAPVTDSVTAYRWLLDHFEPDRIVVAGDSAGGGLAVATLLLARDQGLPMPAAAAVMSPLVDLHAVGPSMQTRAGVDPLLSRRLVLENVALFIGDGDRFDPYAAPLHADLAGLPPLFIQVGDAEVLLDDAVRLAEKAEAAGVPTTLQVWPEMVHVFQASAGYFPEADLAVEHAAAFCRLHFGLSDRAVPNGG
ncbi:alpha/beta hydrolase, partial [Mycolicibacterium sp.]|uniref:alpha/beta hydrolase n=1 Tax=Mycolicibacterium sp. TaxID=2320850 RepID=UPI003D12F5B4